VYYETVFIVNPDVSQENTTILTDSLVERVEKAGGRIVKREYWGARPLAYQIAKRKRGHYTLLVTDGEPAAVAALEQALRLEERVLRFLTTRLQELSDEPSPPLRRRPAPSEQASEQTSEQASEQKEKPEEKAAPEKTAEAAPEKAEEQPAGGDAEA
jgi:small subunit ribosomal protein S6